MGLYWQTDLWEANQSHFFVIVILLLFFVIVVVAVSADLLADRFVGS